MFPFSCCALHLKDPSINEPYSSQGVVYEDHCLVACDAVFSGRNLPTFRRNILTPSLVSLLSALRYSNALKMEQHVVPRRRYTASRYTKSPSRQYPSPDNPLLFPRIRIRIGQECYFHRIKIIKIHVSHTNLGSLFYLAHIVCKVPVDFPLLVGDRIIELC